MFVLMLSYCVVSAMLLLASSAEFFMTPTGRSVPTSLLQHHLREFNVVDWSDHVFEVTSTNHVLSSTSSHDLSTLPLSRKSLHSSDRPLIFINNKRMGDKPFNYLSRKSADNSLSVLSNTDGAPFSIIINGTALHPVDHTLYPGIFIRKPSEPEEKPDDDDDDDNNNSNTSEYSVRSPPSAENERLPFSLTKTDARTTPSNALSKTCLPDDPPRAIETIIQFDSTFCDWLYTDWTYATAAILDAMEIAMMPFHRQTCLQMLVTRVEGFCEKSSNPYTYALSLNSSQLILRTMREEWHSRMDIHRHYVHLFTGELGGLEPPGIAHMGGLCNKWIGYAWTEFLPVSTITHEIGHMLNARHTTNSDIMDSRYRIRWGPQFFSQVRLDAFDSFLKRSGRCVTADKREKKKVVLPNVEQSCHTGFYQTSHYPKFQNWHKVGSGRMKVYRGLEYVSISMHQSYRNVRIYVHKRASEYRIVRWRRRLAMRRLHFEEFGDWVTMPEGEGVRNFYTKWSWANIARPDDMASCCGRDLFVHLSFEACKLPRNHQPCRRMDKVLQLRIAC